MTPCLLVIRRHPLRLDLPACSAPCGVLAAEEHGHTSLASRGPGEAGRNQPYARLHRAPAGRHECIGCGEAFAVEIG